MTFFVYVIIAIVGSSLVSVFSLHIGAAFVGFVLGLDDSLDSGTINGCNWWPWSVIPFIKSRPGHFEFSTTFFDIPNSLNS